MSFLDDLSKSVNYAVSETTSRTKELAGVVKLKTSIYARQNEIDKAYAAIGRAVFEREAADPESCVAALCAKVLANKDAIASMTQQIADLKSEASAERKARAEEIFGSPEAAEEAAEAAENAVETVKDVAEDAAETTEKVLEAVEDVVTEVVEEVKDKVED